MDREIKELAERLLHKNYESLNPHEQNVFRHFEQRLHISKNIPHEQEEYMTFGQRVADRVASFGGSWKFIIIFACVLIAWIAANSFVLIRWHDVYDPYPYILLNLILSMLAAIQAPVILMSQNRHAAKDRAQAEHDYEVNLKAELEIMALHEKLDELRDHQWVELMAMQQEQLKKLEELAAAARAISSGRAEPVVNTEP